MVSKIDIKKSVPRERWGEFFDLFSSGNRGRYISIEIIDSELDNAELINNAPLMAMVYVGGASQNENRPGKGDDLVIEVGRDEVTYAHTIDSPTEVLTGQNSNGVMIALRISDAAGTKTLIQLQAN